MNDNDLVLEATGLSKRYAVGGPLAVDGLNLTIRCGELYGLLGANGAGKTTAINLFLGFLPPTSGSARVCGIDVHADPLEAKRHLAYLPENVMLYNQFTARQNLQYFATLAEKPHDRQHCYDVLRQVGLQEEAFERNVGEFSKGMRQKLGIAVAIVKEAAVILMDEPTTGLDPQAGQEFTGLLENLKREGKAILMSTHDIFRVKKVATRVGILKAGRMVVERTQQELYAEDIEKLYLDYMESVPHV